MQIYFRGLVVALGLTAVLLVFWFLYGSKISNVKPENSLRTLDQLETQGIPEFTLPRMNGEPFSSAKLKGKVIVLNFWATWCAPCVAEFPSMIKMVEHFGGSVELVTIASDEKKEDIERFVNALKLKSEHWVALWDPTLKVAETFGTRKLPETYIFGKDSRLTKKVVNSFDWNSEPVRHYLEELRNKQ